MPKISTGPTAASERARFLGVFAMMLLAFVWVGASLYRVQVMNSVMYADALEAHSMRRVRLPSTRGKIVDRKGVVLADNRPSYCIALFVEELRARGAWSNTVNAVDMMIDKISADLGLEREITRRDIDLHVHRRRPLPLVAWSGLDDDALARFAENQDRWRGADIYVRPERFYPQGDCAAHVIGYVGKGQPQNTESSENEEDYDFYLPDLMGRGGIEESYDNWLAGFPGGELIRIDVSGCKHEANVGRQPVRGGDIKLTIDTSLQKVAERALTGLRGAVVMIDVNTGEVIVMASSPRYDISNFVPSLSPSVWKNLVNNSAHPLLNRAASGIYPPGSIFKPVVALSALNAGLVTPEEKINCPGYYEMPDGRRLRCWNHAGHGLMNLREALQQSCNPYFCEIGARVGFDPGFRADCVTLGLGRRPGIEIPASAALLPSDGWKRKRFGDRWRVGDTANMSIGQGFFSATPLQMAVVTAALANGGAVLRPRLVLEPASDFSPVVARMSWNAASLDAVRAGMWDVVQAPHGTGRRAKISACDIAGKTGTAEYYDRGVRQKHSWMAAFAPFDDPRYAVVVVVENSDSGGKAAAPIVHLLFSAAFGSAPDPSVLPESQEET